MDYFCGMKQLFITFIFAALAITVIGAEPATKMDYPRITDPARLADGLQFYIVSEPLLQEDGTEAAKWFSCVNNTLNFNDTPTVCRLKCELCDGLFHIHIRTHKNNGNEYYLADGGNRDNPVRECTQQTYKLSEDAPRYIVSISTDGSCVIKIFSTDEDENFVMSPGVHDAYIYKPYFVAPDSDKRKKIYMTETEAKEMLANAPILRWSEDSFLYAENVDGVEMRYRLLDLPSEENQPEEANAPVKAAADGDGWLDWNDKNRTMFTNVPNGSQAKLLQIKSVHNGLESDITSAQVYQTNIFTAIKDMDLTSTGKAKYYNLQGIAIPAEALVPGQIYIRHTRAGAEKLQYR